MAKHKRKKANKFQHRINKYVNRKLSFSLTKARVSTAASSIDEEDDDSGEDDEDDGHGSESKSSSLTSNSC